ncbi:AI-2E family transporter [Iodobacter fluviatilis]|uniref:AI-2E family transporter n=1 Tax=Iodobacter fluviatilis TaxID=537 RepID=A0A7G3GB57_9NEIS|nr:AI-2E family transporter [Iodobacter fluviatilis]QBC44627.1 AI-2E family transporter [Iodobacter fluviatilis]
MREFTSSPVIRRLLLGAFLTALALAVTVVLSPFLVPMLWAAILAFASWPLYLRVNLLVGGRSLLAASVLTFLMSALVVLPLAWLVFLLRTESGQLLHTISVEMAAGRLRPPVMIGHLPFIGQELLAWLNNMLADPTQFQQQLKMHFSRLNHYLPVLLGGLGKNVLKLVLALFTLFFVYLHGQSVARQVRIIFLSLLGARADAYLDAVALTTRAVVYGIVLTALIQGLVAGLGYWVAGLSAPIALAAVTVVLAMIPFGTPVVWGAASVYLFFTGNELAALGLFLWGVLVVSWVDNIVRPLVLSGVVDIPFVLALFGVLGGLAAFGLVGLFIGPVILAVALVVWREWLEDERA